MKKQKNTPPPVGEPSVDAAKAIELLKKQKEKAEQIAASRPVTNDAVSSWEALTRNYLEMAFGANSPNVAEIMEVGSFKGGYVGAGPEFYENQRYETLRTQITKLDSLMELLETQISLKHKEHPSHSTLDGNSVFLVHGHNETVTQSVARFLEKLQLDVVILREEANRGNTVIEKFHEHANVAFAVALLTADDRGGPSAATFENQRPRARQNVIFELGFFIGKLGRKRVAALYQAGVEIPSDYQGVIFTPLDDGGAWKMLLARELNAAGLKVDMNLAM